MRPKMTYSNVMVSVLAVVVLGGAVANAAGRLGRNSVGPGQLRKSAVTTSKIKNQAVTAVKIRNGTLTGAQVQAHSLTGTEIDASTLGTVPAARSADSAGVAATAGSLSPAEGWHFVGAPGEPKFLNSWQNGSGSTPVAFYKDQMGVVHIKGYATLGTASQAIFQLPPGYRPAAGDERPFAVPCICPGLSTGVMSIGTGGEVFPPASAIATYLNGVDFRAE